MHDDLDDSLDGLFGGKVSTEPKQATRLPPADYKPIADRIFEEGCTKCRGTGQFVGWNGCVLGQCFACKGQGKKVFKTSAETRQANRQKAVARKESSKAEKRAAFVDAHLAEMKWLVAAASRTNPGFDFPAKMLAAIEQWGELTDGQLGAVRKLMERDKQRVAEKTQREVKAPVVDISKIAAAFDHARGDAAADGEGIQWLRLRLDTFVFSDAPARGQWPAAVFVKEGDSKLGRIVGGKFLRSYVCTDDQEARILKAAADPGAAARAYGQRTGTCSCCGRMLTNADSRAAGIGPICAAKHGW